MLSGNFDRPDHAKADYTLDMSSFIPLLFQFTPLIVTIVANIIIILLYCSVLRTKTRCLSDAHKHHIIQEITKDLIVQKHNGISTSQIGAVGYIRCYT